MGRVRGGRWGGDVEAKLVCKLAKDEIKTPLHHQHADVTENWVKYASPYEYASRRSVHHTPLHHDCFFENVFICLFIYL